MFCLISLINLEVSMKFRLERLPRDENFPAAAIAGTNLYYFFSSRGPHNKMILCHILRNILQELPPERAKALEEEQMLLFKIMTFGN